MPPPTLTLGDGEDQVSLLQELPVQPGGSKQEVGDGSQAAPAHGGLDVLLQSTKASQSAPGALGHARVAKTERGLPPGPAPWALPWQRLASALAATELGSSASYPQVPQVCGLEVLQGLIEGYDWCWVQVLREG